MALFEDKVKAFSARLQKDVGIKGFQADGVFGNLGEESAGFTQLHQRGGYGLGWAQWDDRRHSFEAFAASKGLSVEDDEANYGFLVHELLGSENAALLALRTTHTRDEATEVFMHKFERPGVPALDVRIRWAIRAETARLKQEKTMSDTSNVATTSPAKQPVDQMAAFIKSQELKLEDVAKAFLVSKNVPGFLIDMAFAELNKIDLVALAEEYGPMLISKLFNQQKAA